MISINSNSMASLIAQNLNANTEAMNNIANQITTGKRINSAVDDPAGIGIVSSLNAQSASYGAVQKNLSAGVSLLKVASSSLDSQQGILKQMSDLATQASNGTLTTGQRAALGSTFTQLQSQLDNTVKNANLFGQNLTSSTAASVNIQDGIKAGDTFTLATAKSDSATLGVDSATIDLTTIAKAQSAITAIQTAVDTVSTNQSNLGAQQTGLQSLIEQTKNIQTNLTSSISSIQDADIPALSTQLSSLQAKQQLMTQSLGVVNQFPQYLLGLIK